MLLDYLVKSETRKRLLKLFLKDDIESSINDLSGLANASYAVAYEELLAMKKAGLVKEKVCGRARVYSLNDGSKDVPLLRALFGLEKVPKKSKTVPDIDTVKANLISFNVPLLSTIKLKNYLRLEEALALGVYYSQKDSVLLRTLPVALWKNKDFLDYDKLWHFSQKYKVKRQMGFLLDLTGILSKTRSFNKEVKRYEDSRYTKPVSYFGNKKKSEARRKLEAYNTPKSAQKWLFTMNMGMDSFESFFQKFRTS